MRTMSDYTLYCTPEQARKALELGAPIINYPIQMAPYGVPKFEVQLPSGRWIVYIIPTAEQMIGWLEEQGVMFNIATNPFDEFKVIMSKAGGYNNIANIKWNKSRKEATLAAIDAALEYLTKN